MTPNGPLDPDNKRLSGLPSDWSNYDVECNYDGKIIGLLEMAKKDSNVAHALHNGELKLLGICDGISERSNVSSADDFKLTKHDLTRSHFQFEMQFRT